MTPVFKALLAAIDRSLAYVRTRPADRAAFGPDGPGATWGEMAASLERLRVVVPLTLAFDLAGNLYVNLHASTITYKGRPAIVLASADG